MNKRNYIRFFNNKVEAQLDVFCFENDGCRICYAPALDLAGYGLNEQEAEDSFQIVFNEFIGDIIKNKRVDSALSSLGWKPKKKTALAPDMTNILMTNKTLQRIFNSTSYIKTSQNLSVRLAY